MENRSEIFVVLSSDIFQMFKPGVLTVSRPAFARAPIPAWTKRALALIGPESSPIVVGATTYPTMLASFSLPHCQAPLAGSIPTTEVAPPGPALHTALTLVPTPEAPPGLMMVRSPAESPFALESTPDSGVTG